jgi:SAM-dependent methyltransferase
MASPAAPNLPSYELGRRESEIVARFPSGERVAVTRSRVRAYPGLSSAAPGTLPFYRTFAPLLRGKHVLDAGAGSSIGTRVLTERQTHVTALDHDARALAFGREYTPNAEFVQADLCHGLPIDRADAALLVDVLAHVAAPETVLRGLSACMPVGSQLFVAEAKAYPTQVLSAPARRAFSKSGLARLLLRTGFQVDDILCHGESFLALVAHRENSSGLEALVNAFQLADRGQFAAAQAEFSRLDSGEASASVRLEALLGRAEVAFALHDGDLAARSYFEAHSLNESDGRALAGLARVALATGEFEDARRLSLDSIARDGTDALASASLAQASEQLGHPSAFDAWQTAVNLAPDDPELATGFARVAAAQQNFSFAIQIFERLRAYEGALGVDFHVTLAWLLLADGRRSDAGIEARHAHTLAPQLEAVSELLQAVA